jgi:hypothetical protein
MPWALGENRSPPSTASQPNHVVDVFGLCAVCGPLTSSPSRGGPTARLDTHTTKISRASLSRCLAPVTTVLRARLTAALVLALAGCTTYSGSGASSPAASAPRHPPRGIRARRIRADEVAACKSSRPL